MENELYLDLRFIPRYLRSGIKQFAPDERHAERFNRQNILLLVFEGELCFEEDGEPCRVGAGEYYIQSLGHWQTGNTPCRSPRYCFIDFSGQFGSQAEKALALRGSFDRAKVEPLCEKLRDRHRALAKGGDIGALFEVQTLFFDILNALYKSTVGFAEKKNLAEEIYAYISEHFAEISDLSELAARFCYSKDHIIRVFKSMYRITPYQYLMQCRICYAKLLLASEKASVSEVAYACGFSDVSAFHHAFLRLEGISPSTFRKSN